ncbi:M91 family zinc metallopeptidase [Futiania mangrovi]|uniref:Type III secretion system effector protein n=1 Tax=Futiania mangrovi TaxID=2959716 RepID=A0A9J6PEP6_9PROT|nr:M91 family zinc metallopeptidase [Futiania mangrovii]MCP1336304.1 type III secretion system effector protein [Futiania mangrovii]
MAIAASQSIAPDATAFAAPEAPFTLSDPAAAPGLGVSSAPSPTMLGNLVGEDGAVMAQTQLAPQNASVGLWTSDIPGVPEVNIGGSPAFQAAVSAQLDTLAATATGRAQLTQLGAAAGNTPLYVLEGNANFSGQFRDDNGNVSGNAVVLDGAYAANPDGTTYEQADGTVIPMPMFVTIAHELGHLNGVYSGANQAEGAPPYSDVFDAEENRVIDTVENPLRQEVGLPLRTEYYGNYQY